MVSTKQLDTEKSIIKLEKVSKSFDTENGKALILDEIDLAIKENEFLVLFGAGECGKTTLLKMLAGLESIPNGKILINEIPKRKF